MLLDLHLPRVSGLDILQRLRATPTWNETKVIVITADVLRSGDVQSKADLVLVKPVDPEHLLRLVARFS